MKKLLDNTVVVFIVGILMLIVIPLTPTILDALILFNIVLSLGILLITMYIREALEFSVFPSMLLITTLYRMALNISSTRLILGHGGEAGKVIKTFGEFVIGGDPVVGFIIFLIIVIVQFVVITKGSERVAEVSARFTLDAMPGKQMAIDADLNSGIINEDMARVRRSKIQREADFYGAMDGASKFVKGDAIVSIIIVFINIVAGSVIGMVRDGNSFTEVLSIYTVATVGDGLLSQIPALMISTATGMIVTRAASENNLSTDLSRQLVSFPVTFMISGGVLLLMCLIPGLPVPLLILAGGGMIFLGWRMEKKKQKKETEKEVVLPPSETEFYKNPDNVYTLLNMDPIEMEFGYSLLPLVDEKKGGKLVERIVILRKQFATEMGMVIPSVRLRDNTGLRPNGYVIKLKGEEIARGEVLVDHFLVMGAENDKEIEGVDTVEPAFGIPAKWIDQQTREKAEVLGYTVIDPLSVIVTHLSETIRHHAYELLGRRDVHQLLDNIKKTDKFLVEDFIPSVVSMEEFQRVLCNLLFEQISIRDIPTILETLGQYAATVKDPDILTEYVRQALKRTITHKYSEDGTLKVITLTPEVENLVMNHVKKNDRGSFVSMEPETMHRILAAHKKEVAKIASIVKEPVILTSPIVRLYYRKLIEEFIPDSTVLSYNEIESDIKVMAVGAIAI